MTALLFLPLVAPLLFLVLAVVGRWERGRPCWTATVARIASACGLFAAAAAVATLISLGPSTSPVFGIDAIGLSVRLDVLSVTLFSLVAFVGAIVLRFSRNYLDGDPRHAAFLGGLGATLAAVLLLVLAGNLVQLAVAWIATSLAVQRLLLFYPERPRAQVAARKKAIVGRCGDACLVLALALLAQVFGTSDIANILHQAGTLTVLPTGLGWAAVLLVLAAICKSAQMPVHGWLLEVMETPTPVSALLHAGLINAGGFLVLRFADVLLLAPAALDLLAIIGAGTAVLASLIMLTQTSVKLSLAWSTVAQMGFMLFECGIGAFSIALLHIVAHSLYKAHAFLAAGSIMDQVRSAWLPAPVQGAAGWRYLLGLAMAVGLFSAIALLAGLRLPDDVLGFGLGAILLLGVGHLLGQALIGGVEGWVLRRSLLSATIVTIAYLGLKSTAELVTAGILPAPVPDLTTVAILGATLLAFVLLIWLQQCSSNARSRSPLDRLYVHLRHGCYLNLLFDRLIGAWRPSALIGHHSKDIP